MSDSDASPQRDDRHHCRSVPSSSVFPGCAGESAAECEEWQLAEVAVTVRPPVEQPQAAPSDPLPPAPELVPAAEAAPAAQAADPSAPPSGGAPGAHGAATAAPASHATTPSTPPARGTGPARAPSASPGTTAAAAEGRKGAKYRAHIKPSVTDVSPPKPYPPKAAFPEGRPRSVRALTPKRTPMADMLPQLQRRVVQAGGDGDRAGRGASRGGAERGAKGDQGRLASRGGGEAARGDGHKGRARAIAAREGGRGTGRARGQAAAG